MKSLRQQREDSGLSIQQISDLLGIHRQTWGKWERGEALPNLASRRFISILLWLDQYHPTLLHEWQEYEWDEAGGPSGSGGVWPRHTRN